MVKIFLGSFLWISLMQRNSFIFGIPSYLRKNRAIRNLQKWLSHICNIAEGSAKREKPGLVQFLVENFKLSIKRKEVEKQKKYLILLVYFPIFISLTSSR